jgi:hypothetical protein
VIQSVFNQFDPFDNHRANFGQFAEIEALVDDRHFQVVVFDENLDLEGCLAFNEFTDSLEKPLKLTKKFGKSL